MGRCSSCFGRLAFGFWRRWMLPPLLLLLSHSLACSSSSSSFWVQVKSLKSYHNLLLDKEKDAS